jgi:uncharacterized protein YyaL (SSP411 family)
MSANFLVNEKSPYLQQHAHNPVNWRPWGEDAFRVARQEDKPIFLSVGYSTCHWCHVMERESFENDATAELLNRNFVPIKVDREERPDIDRIYMMFVQATTGSGGWPMSVWLTPDLQPFFGGTYFPPDRRYGHPGFNEVLERIAEAWKTERASIVQSSGDVLNQLRIHAQGDRAAAGLDDSVLDSAFSAFRRSFDTKHGGFGGAPKFPRPSVHNFLLRYYVRTGNLEALEMVFATLNQMALGGIHDHLGGGFHRYAVDGHWFVPHFEKMLYDQAQLAVSYLDGYRISNDESYARAARQILDYVLRDMTSPEGGFYSAEDADSVIDAARPEVKREGAYYVWTKAEIDAVLGQTASGRFCDRYGVTEGGNVHEDPHHEFVMKNILSLAHPEDETERNELGEARRKLFEVRSRRPRPHLDDKILAAWNGLMLSAFAAGARVLGDERYLTAARRAAEFFLARMYNPAAGTLLRRFREGEAAIPGFLDDYAFFAQGLLDLYEASFDTRHLETAIALTDSMIVRFEDAEAGGFFATEADQGNLVMRLKDDYDGAEPSGNSIAILNLLRLAQMTGGKAYRAIAEKALAAFAGRIVAAPVALPQLCAALEYSRAQPSQIVLAGSRDACGPFLREINRRYLPNTIVLLVDSDEVRGALARHAPEIQAMQQIGGAATAYLCENFACRLPTTDPQQFAKMLDRPRAAQG